MTNVPETGAMVIIVLAGLVAALAAAPTTSTRRLATRRRRFDWSRTSARTRHGRTIENKVDSQPVRKAFVERQRHAAGDLDGDGAERRVASPSSSSLTEVAIRQLPALHAGGLSCSAHGATQLMVEPELVAERRTAGPASTAPGAADAAPIDGAPTLTPIRASAGNSGASIVSCPVTT